MRLELQRDRKHETKEIVDISLDSFDSCVRLWATSRYRPMSAMLAYLDRDTGKLVLGNHPNIRELGFSTHEHGGNNDISICVLVEDIILPTDNRQRLDHYN